MLRLVEVGMNPVRFVVFGVAFVGASICTAQQTVTQQILDRSQPFSWDLSMRPDPGIFEDNAVSKVPPAHPEITATKSLVAVPPPAPPRTADSRFFLLNGVHLGMALFDVEMTQRCIANHRCRETNPVMPSSQAGQISVNLALFAYSSGVSYWLKKRKSKLWLVPPSAGVVVHGVGVVTGFEHQ
jgi:hypothetical protein